jgi:hypothetical protein
MVDVSVGFGLQPKAHRLTRIITRFMALLLCTTPFRKSHLLWSSDRCDRRLEFIMTALLNKIQSDVTAGFLCGIEETVSAELNEGAP